jgi:poly-beta-hydroxyalkanoate depolymerase
VTSPTTCFDVFAQCVSAVTAGELIESVSAKDKEFHFQNWFEQRLAQLPFHFEGSGRNAYPDFLLVGMQTTNTSTRTRTSKASAPMATS